MSDVYDSVVPSFRKMAVISLPLMAHSVLAGPCSRLLRVLAALAVVDDTRGR